MDRLLEVRGLVKEFHGRGLLAGRKHAFRAVDRVSFDIERNTIFGLVGESGCGKTTLSRAVLYLDPPTSGDVRIDGTTIGELSTRLLRGFRRRMQIVFQDPNGALNPKMRVQDSLEEGLVNLGVPAAERRRKVEATLELVGIPAEHAGRIVAMIEKEEMDDTEINEVVTFVRDAGGLAYAEAMARRYSDEALAILDLYAPSETRDSLIKLVQFAIAREN